MRQLDWHPDFPTVEVARELGAAASVVNGRRGPRTERARARWAHAAALREYRSRRIAVFDQSISAPMMLPGTCARHDRGRAEPRGAMSCTRSVIVAEPRLEAREIGRTGAAVVDGGAPIEVDRVAPPDQLIRSPLPHEDLGAVILRQIDGAQLIGVLAQQIVGVDGAERRFVFIRDRTRRRPRRGKCGRSSRVNSC